MVMGVPAGFEPASSVSLIGPPLTECANPECPIQLNDGTTPVLRAFAMVTRTQKGIGPAHPLRARLGSRNFVLICAAACYFCDFSDF
jgi:hypothetical protein